MTLAGSAGLLSLPARRVAAEPPPETSTLRIGQSPAICFAPQYLAAEQLFQAEGFGDVQYVKRPLAHETLVSGEADIASSDVGSMLRSIEQGQPLVLLAGLHMGCYELFATTQIRSIRDLVGKQVAIPGLHSGRHLMLSTMLAYVGVDPHRDIHWVTQPARESMQHLAEGTIDAFLGFPRAAGTVGAPGRARVGQHDGRSSVVAVFLLFCRRQPQFCAPPPPRDEAGAAGHPQGDDALSLEPERAARFLVDHGFAPQYDTMVQTLKDPPYHQWREYDSEDTVRFYALRLHEVGLVRSSPEKLIAQGMDWRFFNELKKELKG